jgi:hypothetical protein
MISQRMIDAGNDISSAMMDASIAKSFAGMGGTPADFNEYAKQHNNTENWDIVLRYINDEICAVEGIYLAMERAKE